MDDAVVFDDLLHEQREFPPPEDFARKAVVNDDRLYRQAAQSPEAFWEEQAKELEWFRPWEQTMAWDPPHVKWFVGGKLNITLNCLDRHLRTPRRNKAAIIWEGENGVHRTMTYSQLHREVCCFATTQSEPGVECGPTWSNKSLALFRGRQSSITLPRAWGRGHFNSSWTAFSREDGLTIRPFGTPSRSNSS